MLTRRIILMLALMFFLTASGSLQVRAQNEQAFSDLDQFVELQMRRLKIPGVALAVTRDDEMVYARAFGEARRGIALTTDTPMYIGSTSKTFTALAVMQLVEQGLIDLNAPIQTYLPWFKVVDAEASRKITIRHLLNHASGLSEFDYTERLPNDTSIEAGVRDLQDAGQTYPVGRQSQYFNPNFGVLGAVIEAVSGQAYGEYLRDHIFEPLDMRRTFTNEAEALENGLASGHTFFFGYPLALSQPFRLYGLPEGYIISTANDMAHYAIAMNNGGKYGDTQVIKPESLRQMQKAVAATGGWYGLGWFAGEYRGIPMVSHGGANEFFKSEFMLFPSQKLGVVLLINQMSLLQSYLAYPQLQYGIVDVLMGQQPESGLPTGWIGLALLAAFLITMFFSFRSLFHLRTWRETIFTRSPVRRFIDVAGHLIFPVIFILIMPVVVQAYMQRGFTWKYAVSLAPDMMVWMFLGVGLDLVQFLYKVVFLLRSRSSSTKVGAGAPVGGIG